MDMVHSRLHIVDHGEINVWFYSVVVLHVKKEIRVLLQTTATGKYIMLHWSRMFLNISLRPQEGDRSSALQI